MSLVNGSGLNAKILGTSAEFSVLNTKEISAKYYQIPLATLPDPRCIPKVYIKRGSTQIWGVMTCF